MVMNQEKWTLSTEHSAVENKEIIIEDGLVFGRDPACEIHINSDHISRRHAKLEVLEPLIRVIDLGSVNGIFVNDKKVTEAELKHGDTLRIDDVPFSVHAPIIEDDVDNKTRVRPAVDINKTMVRPAVNVDDRPATVDKNTAVLVDEPASEETVPNTIPADAMAKPAKKDTFEANFDAMSDGNTALGKAWEESDREATSPAGNDGHKTMVMPNIDADSFPSGKGSVVVDANENAPKLVCMSKPFVNQEFSVNQNPTTIGRVGTNDISINEASVSSHHAEIYNDKGTWYITDKESYNGTYVNKKLCQEHRLKNGDMISVGRVQLQFNLAKSDSGFNFIKTLSILLVIMVIAALGAAAYLYLPGMLGGKVQMQTLWSQIQSDGRGNPSQPVLADVNNDGRLDVVIAAESGKLEMIGAQNALSFNQIKTGLNIQSSPAILDVNKDGRRDFVVSSIDGQVIAFDAIGSKLWQYQPHTPITSILNYPEYFHFDQDGVLDVVISTENQGVVAVSGATGSKLWDSADKINGRVITSPLIGDFNNDGATDVIVATDLNQLLSLTVRGPQVSINWQQSIPPLLFSSPIFAKTILGPSIVIATQDAGVVSLNAINGNQTWQARLEGQSFFASPVQVSLKEENIIVVVDLNGVVTALDNNNGKHLWSYKAASKVQSTPAVITLDGSQYIALTDTDAQLHLLDAGNGSVKLKQSIDNADHFVTSPVVSDVNGDGRSDLILASQNGKIFGLSFLKE